MPRALRRWITSMVANSAVRAAPWLPPGAQAALADVIRWAGPHTPVLARLVRENLRLAGAAASQRHARAVADAYFARLGEHFDGALYAQHCAGQKKDAAALATRAAELFDVDASLAELRAAAAEGGAILVGPHITNYLLYLARLREEVPLTVYLRHSKDPRRQAAKQRWYAASGVEWICEPAGVGGPLGRVARMTAALAAGRVLYITPDLPQRRGDGVAVRLLGREIWLPGGAGLLAVRTGAPLFYLDVRANSAATPDGRAGAGPLPLGVWADSAAVTPDGRAGAWPDGRAGAWPLPPRRRGAAQRRLIVRGPYREPGALAPRRRVLHVVHPPHDLPPHEHRPCAQNTGRAARRTAVAARMQWFADLFAEFLHAEPAAWYLWGDKRWTRVWHGDQRYARRLTAPRYTEPREP